MAARSLGCTSRLEAKSVKFEGRRIRLPWERWAHVEISPEGIHTTKGLIRPDELELLRWKANFYDRGTAALTRHTEHVAGRPLQGSHGEDLYSE